MLGSDCSYRNTLKGNVFATHGPGQSPDDDKSLQVGGGVTARHGLLLDLAAGLQLPHGRIQFAASNILKPSFYAKINPVIHQMQNAFAVCSILRGKNGCVFSGAAENTSFYFLFATDVLSHTQIQLIYLSLQ